MPLSQPPSKTPSPGSNKFLQRANELKEAGNFEMRRGRMLKGHTASKHSLAEACVHYARGLQQIEMAKKEGNVDDGHIRDALLPLYLNLSAANLMLEGGGGVDRVVEVAALTLPERRNQEGSSTTIFDPTDASVIVACKALYRRGQAKAGEGRMDEALSDLRRALVLCPRDSQVRRVYFEVEDKNKKKQAREDLERETKLGKERQQRNIKGNQEQNRRKTASNATIQPERKEKKKQTLSSNEDKDEEIRTMMKNGGIGGDGSFKWSQTISNLQLTFILPKAMHSSDVNVTLHRRTVHVSYHLHNMQQQQASSTGGDSEVIEVINGRLYRPIRVDESTWTLEKDGHLLVIDLCKELPSDGPNGFEWWNRVLEDDEKIDMRFVNAGMDLRDYPEHIRHKISHTLWNHSTACQGGNDDHTPDLDAEAAGQQEKSSQEDDLKIQSAKEQEDNEVQKARVLKDPIMTQLYTSLKEKFPDTDILFNKQQ